MHAPKNIGSLIRLSLSFLFSIVLLSMEISLRQRRLSIFLTFLVINCRSDYSHFQKWQGEISTSFSQREYWDDFKSGWKHGKGLGYLKDRGLRLWEVAVVFQNLKVSRQCIQLLYSFSSTHFYKCFLVLIFYTKDTSVINASISLSLSQLKSAFKGFFEFFLCEFYFCKY